MVLARFQQTLTDQAGNIIANATITVRRESDGGLATIYSDRAGATPKSNPFTITSGDNGLVAFYAAGNAYKVTAVSGAFTAELRYKGVGTAQEYDSVEPLADARAFGAVGDGSTDDKVALQAFFNNPTKAGILPKLTFRVTGPVDIPSDFTLLSLGGTIHSASANITRLRMLDVDDITIFGKLFITGPGKSNGSGVGLRMGGNNRCRIQNVHASGIDGKGFHVSGGTYDSPRGDKTQIVTCSAKDCYTGWKDDPNAASHNENEYATNIGFHATGCNEGIATSPGNISWIGPKAVDNTDGFAAYSGNNGTHAPIVGGQFNHNTGYNINLDSQSAGMSFVGCAIVADDATHGYVRAVNSRGIQFLGCMFESSVLLDGAASQILIQGCYNNNNFTMTFGGTNPERIFCFDNFDATNVRPTWSDRGYDFVSAVRATSSQSITSATDTTIIFNSETADNQGGYDPTTGIFTCKIAGPHRVSAQVLSSNSGGFTGGFIFIRKNSTVQNYAPLVSAAGFPVGGIEKTVDLAVGDTITIRANITATSPTILSGPETSLQITCLR